MKRIMKYLLICVLSILLTTCSSTVSIDAASNGETVEITPGSSLKLSLKGNPTTGYLWQVIEIDDSILKPVGESKYKSDSNLAGSAGEFTFLFSAQKPGQTTLKLGYLRPWESGVEPLEIFEVNI